MHNGLSEYELTMLFTKIILIKNIWEELNIVNKYLFWLFFLLNIFLKGNFMVWNEKCEAFSTTLH